MESPSDPIEEAAGGWIALKPQMRGSAGILGAPKYQYQPGKGERDQPRAATFSL